MAITASQLLSFAPGGDKDNDGVIDPGDIVQFSVTIQNDLIATATNVSFSEMLNGMTDVPGTVTVTPIAFDDAFTGVTGNSPINLNVLANDIDPNASSPLTNAGLTIHSVDASGTAGTVKINNDGTVTFVSNAGFTGTTAFTYFTQDAEGLKSNEAATVTVTVNGGQVWYVDGAYTGANGASDGTFDRPFTDFTKLNGVTGDGTTNDDVDGENDTIFVYDNAAGTLSYSGGIVLENEQVLIGDGVAFTVNGIAIGHGADDAAHNPTVTSSGTTLTLAENNTVRGLDLGNATTALSGTSFGTLTIDNVAISTNGQALNLNSGTFNGGAAFSSITSSGGANNINLAGVNGSVNLGSGALSGATGTSFNVNGGMVSTTYSGNISQTNNAAMVNVSSHGSGTLTFQTGTLNATNGTGLQFTGADGTYNFNGTTTLNGGDAGIDLIDGTDGGFNFGTGTSITNPTGTAFRISGTTSASTVVYSGSITDNSGFAVEIDNHDAGTVKFQTGSITSTGAGIKVSNSNGGSISFSGQTGLSTGTNTAVDLSTGNAGGTVNFSAAGTGLDITTSSGTGFHAGSGTVTVQGSGNSITSTGTGQIVKMDGTQIGASGITFAELKATSTPQADAISLNNVDGSGTFNGGAVTIAGTVLSGSDGIAITGGSAATFTFASATIDNTTGDGLNLDGANGTVTFTTIDLDGIGGTGVSIIGNTNAVNINGGTIGATNDPAVTGLDIKGGSGAVNVAASITRTTAGDLVEITDRTAGTIVISGNLTTSSSGGGIDVSSNAGGTINFSGTLNASSSLGGISVLGNTGGTVNFTGQTTLNTSTGTAVDLDNNTNATINFNAAGNGLDITTSTGKGFDATGGGTITVQGGGNSINSSSATALNVANTTIGSSGLNFQSISAGNNTAAADPVNGIVLNNTGNSGGLTITGSGNTAQGGDNSGGTIQNSTGAGISLTSTRNVSLTNVHVLDAKSDAVLGTGVTNFTLANSRIEGAGDAVSEHGLDFGTGGVNNLLGSATISGSIINNTHQHAVHVENVSGALTMNVTSSAFTGNHGTEGGAGILFEADGNANMTLRVNGGDGSVAQRNTFSNLNTDGILVNTEGIGSIATLIAHHNTFDTIGGSTGAIAITGVGGSSNIGSFNIHHNTVTNFEIEGITVAALDDSELTGVIADNTVIGDTAAPFPAAGTGRGIVISADGGPGLLSPEIVIDVLRNNVSGTVDAPAVFVRSRDGNAGFVDMIFEENTIGTPINGGNLGSSGVSIGAEDGMNLNLDVRDRDNDNINNTSSGFDEPNTGNSGYRLVDSSTGTLGLVGFTTGGNVQNFFNAENNTGSVVVSGGAPVTGTARNYVTPPALLAASGGFVSDAVPDANTSSGDSSIAPSSAFPQAPVQNPANRAGSEAASAEPVTQIPPQDNARTEEENGGATSSVPPISSSAGATTPIVDDGVLSQDELDFMVAAARARWETTGLTIEQTAALDAMRFTVADMDGLYLGSASAEVIHVDSDGAGYGWFIDATPGDDSEFGITLASTRLQSFSQAAPAGHIDLLTTVMHEMGHVLGAADLFAVTSRNSLMYGYLVTGERRLATQADAWGAIAGTIDHEDFLASPVNVGTLPPGRSVTITFNAQVDAQTNQLITNPANFGTAEATFGFDTQTTDTNTVVAILDTLTLGDLVYKDTNGNNVFDSGTDAGIDGVALTLFADATANGSFDPGLDTAISTATTASGGLYSFGGLAPGDYIVRVDASNFNIGGVLEGFVSVTGANDPDDNVDNDDNADPFTGHGVVTPAITLSYNNEPTAGTGNDTNNTLDIGFTAGAPVDQPAVAKDDAFTTAENVVLTGANVLVDNGSGADTDPDSPLKVTAVNGSVSNVGVAFALGSGALVTLNQDGTLTYDPNNKFNFVPAPDSGASKLTAPDTFSYTLNGTAVAVVTLTITGVDSDGDIVIGTPGVDNLNAGIGNDFIDGLEDADNMTGGPGDDRYIVDNVNDVTIEQAGAGTGLDIVESSVTYTLNANVEDLILSGDAAIDGTGNALNNKLTGNSKANTLSGGLGTDTTAGLDGDDTYIVERTSDIVIESLNEGIDTVLSSATFVLGPNVENLTLTGTAPISGIGNTLANKIIGNSAVNSLSGGDNDDHLLGMDGNDLLNGGTGADKMEGGAHNDTYVVDNILDQTIELFNGGVDTVSSSVSVSLQANVEKLTLSGLAAIDGSGNELDNTITGNSGANQIKGFDGNDILSGLGGIDTIWGGIGNDWITGGAGADTLSGEAGSDRFSFNALSEGIDFVTDFTTVAGNNDVLDIKPLLLGFNPATSDPNNFVRLTQQGADTLVEVNADGVGIDFVGIATLQNTSGLTVNGMFANGNLMMA